jgi:DNA sulfur modification protein DndD
MIIDELVLHNFGIYHGRHEIALTPPSKDRPIILFGGLNGYGKTTIIDALQICLFGIHAKSSNRDIYSYPEYLNSLINKNSLTKEAALELEFRHTVAGKEERYRLHRSWKTTPSGTRETFIVSRNNKNDLPLTENWIHYVEELLPSAIAHLFFFDGEKIEAYAQQDTSSKLIQSAIQSLLGLDIVDQLTKDLLILERKKLSSIKTNVNRKEIHDIEEELKSLRTNLENIRGETASVRTHKVERTRLKLDKVEQAFKRLGGDLYNSRIDIENKYTIAANEIQSIEQNMREISSAGTPLLLVSELLESVMKRAAEEIEATQAMSLLKAFSKRDAILLKRISELDFPKELINTVKSITDKTEQDLTASIKILPTLNLDQQSVALLNKFISTDVELLKKSVDSVSDEYTSKKELLDNLEKTVGAIPTADALSDIVSERVNLNNQLDKSKDELNSLIYEEKRLEKEIERKINKLHKILEANSAEQLEDEDSGRIIEHSRKVSITLSSFRSRVIGKHVRRIESLVFECYKLLLRKNSLLNKLEINPDTFELILYSRDNSIISTDRLSAGERQLLAVALLWGLAKASGRPLPTAIDTPLGRLDHGHRDQLVSHYFPFASHQVLLLSTDAEIGRRHLSQLKPWIGRSYVLFHDDLTGNTSIQNGYFNFEVA